MITRKVALMITAVAFSCVLSQFSQGKDFPSFIQLDPSLGEFPEGVAVDKVGNVYVSIGGAVSPRGAVYKFSPSGQKSVLVDFGTPGAAGLAVDAKGNVFVARATAPNNGVYCVDRDGHTFRLPGTEEIVFPNSIAFDQRGNLYVTETFSIDPLTSGFGPGGIWRMGENENAELWLRDELLTGLDPFLFPYPVGANGIAFYRGNLYVVNTDKALIVRVPVAPNGSPGQPEIWKQASDVPESIFYGTPFPLLLDGIALDVHGNAYVAVPSRAAVIRINASDLSQEVLAVSIYPDLWLDAPLSLAFGTGKKERGNLFVTIGGISALFAPNLPWVGPGVAKIEAGIPGLPLP